jgi:hypothetical protein
LEFGRIYPGIEMPGYFQNVHLEQNFMPSRTIRRVASTRCPAAESILSIAPPKLTIFKAALAFRSCL